jgi:hypothetical protein
VSCGKVRYGSGQYDFLGSTAWLPYQGMLHLPETSTIVAEGYIKFMLYNKILPM